MISQGLFYHISMIALAAGIAFFYIQPTFTDIRSMQDEIELFKTERAKVDKVNADLASLVDTLNSIPASNQQKLVRYMPDTVDEIAVQRTLQLIANDAGLLFEGVSYNDVLQDNEDHAELAGVTDYPTPHLFTVSVQGTYTQIKRMLSLYENNEFPLEIYELDLSRVQGNFLQADISVVTYSHLPPEPSFFSPE